MAKIVIGKPKAPANSAPPQPSMFGGPPPPSSGQIQIAGPTAGEEMSTLGRRVKMLEERHTNIRSKFQIMEQNMLQKNKSFFTDIKSLNLEIIEVKKEINELKDKIVSLIREMDNLARKENVEILRKYIDFWAPVNFVTKNEIEDIVRDVIDKMRKGK